MQPRIPTIWSLIGAAGLALGALPLTAAPAAAQAGCALPGMDVLEGTHPYGAVDPNDGQLDYIEAFGNQKLTYQFSLAGQDHDSSLGLAPSFLKFVTYNASLAEIPFHLSASGCAFLQLPLNGPLDVVPDTLEIQAALPLSPGLTGLDLYFQSISVDLSLPELPLALSDLIQVRYRQPVATGDPATIKDYSCYYWGYYIWNDLMGQGPVEGRIYWPSDCVSQSPPSTHPLVLLTHGDGHDYTDYHYLMRHLAFNGFIAATIDNPDGISNVARAERVRTYLNFIRNDWEFKDHVENNVALAGHSRGGEAIFTAARKINQEWGLDHDVNALIALAPTDNDEGGGEGLETLSGFDSESLLVIYGSRDEDVYGYCTSGQAQGCGGVPVKPQATGFALYDRAGWESSTENTGTFTGIVTKSMLFLDRATHNGVLDSCQDSGGQVFQTVLSCDAHHAIAKGYLNAFLRWRLRGEDAFKPFFTGEAVPDAVADENVRVRTQYTEGPGRRVIDNFEQPGWSTGTQSTVTKNTQVTILKEGTLFDYGDYTAPHETRGLALRWSTLPILVDPWIRWTIDDATTLFGQSLRDVSKFDVLSFRVGQVHGSADNTPGESQNFTVRLMDEGGVWSPKVHVAAFADVAYPDSGEIITVFDQYAQTPKSAMMSVRIPLGYFTGVDLDNVQEIELAFGVDENLQGELLIDSLEFSD